MLINFLIKIHDHIRYFGLYIAPTVMLDKKHDWKMDGQETLTSMRPSVHASSKQRSIYTSLEWRRLTPSLSRPALSFSSLLSSPHRTLIDMKYAIACSVELIMLALTWKAFRDPTKLKEKSFQQTPGHEICYALRSNA